MLEIARPVNSSFARFTPAFHPVRNINAAIHSKLDIRNQDTRNEWAQILHFERGAARFQREGEYRALQARSLKIRQEKMTIQLRRQPGARTVGESRGTFGKVRDRRDQERGLFGIVRVPHFLGIPYPARHRPS